MLIEQTTAFVELAPRQKAQIVALLQQNGHSVGFLGDGMNDLSAELAANVSISVDTSAEAVKESADVILLRKDLNVLEQGILEGRRAFANMAKYIKITASSNFGNICAIVVASVLLPFFPMTSLQLLLLRQHRITARKSPRYSRKAQIAWRSRRSILQRHNKSSR